MSDYLLTILIIAVIFFFIIWQARKGHIKALKEINARKQYRESVSYEDSPSPWEIQKKIRNGFATLYKNQEWAQLIDYYHSETFIPHREWNDTLALIMALDKLGRFEEAKATAEELYDDASSYEQSQLCDTMAIMLSDRGAYIEAIGWLQRIDMAELRHEKSWYQYYRYIRVGAKCFMSQNKFEEAIPWLSQAPINSRILNKDLADVHELLGQCFEETGELKRALKHYQKVVTVRYSKELNGKILELNGMIYELDAEKEARARKKKS